MVLQRAHTPKPIWADLSQKERDLWGGVGYRAVELTIDARYFVIKDRAKREADFEEFAREIARAGTGLFDTGLTDEWRDAAQSIANSLLYVRKPAMERFLKAHRSPGAATQEMPLMPCERTGADRELLENLTELPE